MRKLFKHTPKDSIKGTKEVVEVYFAKVCAKDCSSCSFLVKKITEEKVVLKSCVFEADFWEEIPSVASHWILTPFPKNA